MFFVYGQLLRQSERHSPRYNSNFVNRIRTWLQSGDKGMAGFVIGSIPLFFITDDHAFSFHAHQDFVFGIFEIAHIYRVFARPCRVKRRFVNKTLYVGARRARRSPRNNGKIHIIRQGRLLAMNFKYLLPPPYIGKGNNNLSVKTSRPQKSGIKNVRTIGGRNEDYAVIRFKTIHLNKQLIQCLFPFVMPAAETGAPVSSHRIDLIDEDDAGRILFRLRKKVPYARGAHADKHLYKVGTTDAEKRDISLAGDCPRQQGLAGAGGANQEQPLRYPPAQPGKFLGVLKKFDDLLQFRLGLVNACDIGEGYFFRFIRLKTGPAFAEGPGPSRPATP